MRACAGDSSVFRIALEGVGFLVVWVMEISSTAFLQEYPKRSCHILIIPLCSLLEDKEMSSSGSSYAALIAKLSSSSRRSIVMVECCLISLAIFEGLVIF